MPNVAATVAYRLGIPAPGAYDLNAACAGFCYAIGAAADSVRAGSARNVLVIGAEKMTSWIDWTDRSTCIIFADGAGAAVVGPTAEASPPVSGRSSGARRATRRTRSSSTGRTGALTQDGQAVFRWATTAMAPVALRGVPRAGVTPADITAFVPHQANLRIIEAIARKLGIPASRRRRRHHPRGQHLVGVDPAGAGPDGRAGPAAAGHARAADRVRRRACPTPRR